VKEVLLRETVENLGRRGDVVRVADGYARNFLLPRKLALPVTTSNQRQIEREKVKSAVLDAEEQQGAEAVAQRIGGLECVLTRRVGETEVLFGSVTSADVADFLASQKLDVDKRKIQLSEPIKTLGEVSVPIKLHREVTAFLRVHVVKRVEEGGDNVEGQGASDVDDAAG
jgi:large subunit ribosomal protein L9